MVFGLLHPCGWSSPLRIFFDFVFHVVFPLCDLEISEESEFPKSCLHCISVRGEKNYSISPLTSLRGEKVELTRLVYKHGLIFAKLGKGRAKLHYYILFSSSSFRFSFSQRKQKKTRELKGLTHEKCIILLRLYLSLPVGESEVEDDFPSLGPIPSFIFARSSDPRSQMQEKVH